MQEIVIPKYVEVTQYAAPKPSLFAHIAEEVLLSYGVPKEWLPDVQRADEDNLLGYLTPWRMHYAPNYVG